METVQAEKKLVQVWLEDDIINVFDNLKIKLKFKNDSEVLRHAIVFTEKRTPK
jgi:hypothetical protein